MKIHKGDNIIMLSGKDKGKQGKVIRVFPKEEKVIIEGLNLLIRHQKPRKQGQKGVKVTIPRKVLAGKVMFVCPQCSHNTRIAYRIEGDKKERICKKCERVI